MTETPPSTPTPESPPNVPAEPLVLGDVDDLRQVLNHLKSGVVAHAPDTSIRVCNPRACEILGLTLDQMIGVTAPDPKWAFLREDGSPMPLDEFPVNVVLRTKTRLEGLLVGVNRPAHDDLVWADCNGYPVFADDGTLELIIITFIDVTELRQAEQARRELEEQLRQRTKMEAIGRLAGGVAHDFNNILTAIMGYAELLETTLDADHPSRRFAREIQNGGERASELTQGLLAFARKQVVEPQVMQINDVLGRAEGMLQRLIGDDIEMVFEPGADLHNVCADPGQLDQVLLNLVVNARDAMPSGGRVVIRTRAVHLRNQALPTASEPLSGEFVVLSVRDDGEGMDPATRERIFEPFFSTKGPGLGTGLGLATVYGIVRQNQGFIEVDSAPGEGARFTVYLPAVVEPITAASAPEPEASAPSTAVILLVEDEEMVRELVRQVLGSQGFTVLEAPHAEGAMALLGDADTHIDLLLSDVMMPGMSGPELFDHLRIQRPGLRALFMSGYTEDAVAGNGAPDSAAEFIAKPFTIRSLRNKVAKMLG